MILIANALGQPNVLGESCPVNEHALGVRTKDRRAPAECPPYLRRGRSDEAVSPPTTASSGASADVAVI